MKLRSLYFNPHLTLAIDDVTSACVLTKEFRVSSIIHRLDEQIGECVDFFFLNGRCGSLVGVTGLRFQGSRSSGSSTDGSAVGGTATATAVRRIGRRRVVRRTSQARHAASGTVMMVSRLNRLVQRLVVRCLVINKTLEVSTSFKRFWNTKLALVSSYTEREINTQQQQQ